MSVKSKILIMVASVVSLIGAATIVTVVFYKHAVTDEVRQQQMTTSRAQCETLTRAIQEMAEQYTATGNARDGAMNHLRDFVLESRVGEFGYAFILQGTGAERGKYIISKDGQRDGENIWEVKDSDGQYFIQTMINQATAARGEIIYQRYPWKNDGDEQAEMKVAAVAYYEPLDWVIGTGAYENDRKAIARVEHELGTMLMTTITTTLIVLGVSVALALLVTSRMIKPLELLVGAMAKVRESGDLTVHVDIRSKDEIGRMAQGFNHLVETLRTVIGGVASNSRDVAAASAQIASSSDEISGGMENQSDAVMQISAAMEEMLASVEEVTRQTFDAVNEASAAGQLAEDGGGLVAQMMTRMEQISQAVSEGAESVRELGKRGDAIGRIIAVINDIADQTNLLALNAAIEAARAGEHGRGFAVVANEVRKLADRTMEATQEIADSIRAIQEGTNLAIQRMQAGTDRVTEGVGQAKEAGESLGSIVTRSHDVASKIRQIAAASGEQSTTSKQVVERIESIVQVSQRTAAATSQASTAANDLSSKAEQVMKMVGQFRVEKAA